MRVCCISIQYICMKFIQDQSFHHSIRYLMAFPDTFVIGAFARRTGVVISDLYAASNNPDPIRSEWGFGTTGPLVHVRGVR